MFGKVYFTDGRVENIKSYQFNLDNTELYFTTESGSYGYTQRAKSSEYEFEWSKNLIYWPCYQFYKYNKDYNKWLAILDIVHIEIYEEVLHD